jgi:hypothetical protein
MRGRRVRLQLSQEASRRLARLSWLLERDPEELLQAALQAEDVPPDQGGFAALEEELSEGQRQFSELAARLSQVQSRYAAVKFELFEEFQRNRPLVVNLCGALAENQRLRQALGMAPGWDEPRAELDRFFRGYLQRDLEELRGARTTVDEAQE